MDKLENKQLDYWYCELFESSLMADALSTSSVSAYFRIGRLDTSYFITLTLFKNEQSAVNATLESSLKGAKGDEFIFGFNEGDPLKFVVSSATNETKTSFGNIITTVTLTSNMGTEDLGKIKDVLTGKSLR